MSAILDEIQPGERELEALWRRFHAAWVRADEALAEAQEGLLERERCGGAHDLDRALVQALRAQERQCFAVLEQFERSLHDFRSRTAAYRAGYR